MGTPEVANGYGLFVYDTSQVGLDLFLGSFADKNDLATQIIPDTIIGQIEVLLAKNTGDIKSKTLTNIIWEIFTNLSDPTGVNGNKGIMPDADGTINLHLGGFSNIKSDTYTDVKYPHVVKHLQEDYRVIYNEEREGKVKKNLHRKYLQTLVEKYKLSSDRFIPKDLPKEKPLPHETTLTDNFNRTDAADMSTSAPYTWTDVGAGDWQISSNAAKLNTKDAVIDARVESDLSSTDHSCIGTMLITAPGTGSNVVGVMMRFSSSADTGYTGEEYRTAPSTVVSRVEKRVAGVGTVLGTPSTGLTYATSDTVKIQAVGSTIKRFRNGSQSESFTDTAITTGTRCGIMGFINGLNTALNVGVDNWTATDVRDIKTKNGLSWANVKTLYGLAVASVKKVNGGAAQ